MAHGRRSVNDTQGNGSYWDRKSCEIRSWRNAFPHQPLELLLFELAKGFRKRVCGVVRLSVPFLGKMLEDCGRAHGVKSLPNYTENPERSILIHSKMHLNWWTLKFGSFCLGNQININIHLQKQSKESFLRQWFWKTISIPSWESARKNIRWRTN